MPMHYSKFHVLLLLLLSSSVFGTKRRAEWQIDPDYDDDQMVCEGHTETKNVGPRQVFTRKRTKGIRQATEQAIKNGQAETFSLVAGPLDDLDYERTFEPFEPYLQLMRTIKLEHAKLLRVMLYRRIFRKLLNPHLIKVAIKARNPSLLYVLVQSAKDNPNEWSWIGDASFTGQDFLESSMTYRIAKTKLLLNRIVPDYYVLKDLTMKPEIAIIAIESYLRAKGRSLDQKKLQILSIVRSYIPWPSSDTFFDRLVLTEPTENSLSIPSMTQINALFDIIVDGNAAALRTYFSNTNLRFSSSQPLVAAHLATAMGKGELLEHIALTETRPPRSLTGHAFRWIIQNALMYSQFDLVRTFLLRFDKDLFEEKIETNLRRIFYDAIWSFDFGLVVRLAEAWPKDDYPLSDRGNKYLSFAKAIVNGDWRYLLVFMEVNPELFFMSDAAWDYILNPRQDLFLKVYT